MANPERDPMNSSMPTRRASALVWRNTNIIGASAGTLKTSTNVPCARFSASKQAQLKAAHDRPGNRKARPAGFQEVPTTHGDRNTDCSHVSSGLFERARLVDRCPPGH